MKTFVSSPLSLSNSTLSFLFKTKSSPLIAQFFDMLQKDDSLFRVDKFNKIWKFSFRVLSEQSKSLLFGCTWQGKSLLKLIQNSIMKEFRSFVIILSYVSVHFPSLCHLTNSNPLTWRHMTRTKSRTRRRLLQTDCTSVNNRQLNPFSTLLLSSLNPTICNVGKSEIDEARAVKRRERLSQAQEMEMEEEHSAGATGSQPTFKGRGRGRFAKVGTVEV